MTGILNSEISYQMRDIMCIFIKWKSIVYNGCGYDTRVICHQAPKTRAVHRSV